MYISVSAGFNIGQILAGVGSHGFGYSAEVGYVAGYGLGRPAETHEISL